MWDFAGWRVVHVVLGLALVTVMAVHTGGRLGHNLDRVMSLAALAALLSGALIAVVVARQHQLAPGTVRRVQRSATWVHILALWGLPVLLGFHVLKAYYF